MLSRIICCALLLCIVSCQKKSREGVAVIVNGYEIPSAQVMQTAELLRESMVAAYPGKAVEGIDNELLAGAAQQLIAHRLLLEEAQKLGITADSAAVDSMYEMLRSRAPDQAAFERELIKMGESRESLREQISEGVRLEKLMRRIFATVPKADSQECLAFYEKNKDKYTGTARVRAGQIFLPFTDSMQDTEKQKLHASAKELRKQILAGTPFNECAKKHSKGPGALDGGDIGWFKKGDLRKDLEEPLFMLKKGEISDIITTNAGLFILQKSDEEAEKQLPYEEVAESVRFVIELKERNRIVGEHLDSLKKLAKVEYIDTSLAVSRQTTPALLPGMID